MQSRSRYAVAVVSFSKRVVHRGRRWLLLGVLALATAAGCNVIFGIEQHEPFPAGGGGSGASSGTGGGTGGGRGTSCSSVTECQGVDTTCEYRTCAEGICGIVQAAEDTACTEEGGQVCDGEGHCVECNSAAQCNSGEICQQHLCVSQACANNLEDGNETDVDCGGGDCPPCANSLECLTYSDCQSRFCDASGGTGGSGAAGVCAPCASDNDCTPVPDAWCDLSANGGECADLKVDGAPCSAANECLSGNCPADDGVCCDTPCTGQCEACRANKTGGSDGTCASVTAGADPDNECPDAPGACGPDGTGCNGDAVDSHCNGGQCSCAQQYTHPDIYQTCDQTSTECTLRVTVNNVDCVTICQVGGGECVAFHNDNPNGTCGIGAPYPCTLTGYNSAICICSRGCGGDAACAAPFICTGGDCL